jgi:hypothetical protein
MNFRKIISSLCRSQFLDCYSSAFPYLVPPTLREDVELSDICKARVGSNVVLEIPFKAYPKPAIKWIAKGSIVTDSTRRYRVDTVAGLTSLSIQRVQPEDAGQLKVVIENEYGKLIWKYELLLIGKQICCCYITSERICVKDNKD